MSLRSTFLRLLLRAPDSLLVRASGGSPLTIGGHTLDARLQFLHHAARNRTPLYEMPVEKARTANDAFAASIADRPPESVATEDLFLSQNGLRIGARLYRPPVQDPATPVMVFYHMGGGVLRGLDMVHYFCALLSEGTGGVVLSVDYRLAPEQPFPAGLEDAIAAYEWALANAESLGAPAGQAAVGGDSMGGNFAAVVCQEMKADDKPQPVLQLLIYPATDLSEGMPSLETYGHIQHLTKETMSWFGHLYLPEGVSPETPRVSPAQTQNLEGLAPALVYTAGFDAIRDNGARYAQQLKGEMVPVRYKVFETLAHGFTAHTGICPAARLACDEIVTNVSKAYKQGLRA